MTLRTKTLLASAISVVAALTVLYAVSSRTLLRGFADVEEEAVRQNVDRLRAALDGMLEQMETTVSDWARWDDSYEFVATTNADFIRVNVSAEGMETLAMDWMAFLDLSGRLVYGWRLDREEMTLTDLPPDFLAQLAPGDALPRFAVSHDSVNGIVLCPSASVLVAAQPILNSGEDQPPRGTLVMARFLDDKVVGQLSRLTGLAVCICRLDEDDLCATCARAAGLTDEPGGIVVQAENEDRISGYVPLNDVYGRPALVARVDQPRTIYAHARYTLSRILLVLFGVGLAYFAVVVLVSERLVISRLARLGKQVGRISATGPSSTRLMVSGGDEVAAVTRSINAMLDTLDRSHEERLQSEIRYSALIETTPDVVYNVSRDGTLASLSPSFERLTGWPVDEWIGRSFRDLVHPEDVPLAFVTFQGVLSGERPAPYVLRIRKKSGVYVIGEFSSSPQVEDGQVVGAFGIARDVTGRIRAQEAAKEALGRFEAVIESTPLVAVEGYGRDGTVRHWNKAAEMLYGFTAGEAVGKKIQDLLQEDPETGCQNTIAEVWRTGRPTLPQEWSVRTKSGGGRWVYSVMFPVRDEGRVTEVFCMDMDITERKAADAEIRRLLEQTDRDRRALLGILEDQKRAEGALRESENRYRTLFDDAKDGMALAEAETGTLVDCNQALCRMVERTKDELVGQPQALLHVQEDVARGLSSSFRRHQEGNAGLAMEDRLLSKSGRIIPVEIRGTKIRMAGRDYLMGVFRDVTDRQQAQEAVRESEAKYRALVEQAPGITYTAALDEASTTLYISPQIESILGYTPAEYAAEPDLWRKLVHPDDLDRVIADVENTHKTGQPYSAEYRMIAKGGRLVWVRDQGAIVRDAAGKPLLLQGVMYDVTQLKQAEEEIRKLNAELEQRVKERTAQLEAANKEMESFSYSVSHDLRAPLRAISGFSQVILEEGGLQGTAAQNFDRVRAAAQKMSGLIDDLLGLSRITRREMQRRPVDLTALARQIAAALRKEEPARDVEIRISDGLAAEGDPDLLEIVLRNLLENAWKFTSKREDAKIEFGCMSISDFRSQMADVKNQPLQSAISNLTSHIYYVRDNGAGFDMAYAGKLFGPFQRLHSGAEFQGTGIGLATVQRIISRHGGWVWAEGEVGKGATVFFAI